MIDLCVKKRFTTKEQYMNTDLKSLVLMEKGSGKQRVDSKR